MAAERLNAFRTAHELSFRALAKKLGVGVGTAHALCTGRLKPGLALAVRIESATAHWVHGPVKSAEWVPEAAA